MDLSYFKGGEIGAQVVGSHYRVHIDNATALELVHRLNVERHSVSSSNDDFDDVLGMWRKFTKPHTNEIDNLTWKIPVDIGFRYLVRIHYQNLGHKSGGLIFKVLINEKIVDTNIHLVEERDVKENGILLWYRDYKVAMKGRKQDAKRDLLISLMLYDHEEIDVHRLLKGFEVFKLSNHDNSLASPNALPPPTRDSQSSIIQNLSSVLSHRNTISNVAITIIALINIIVYGLGRYWESITTEEENKLSTKAERHCRRFSLAEIQSATRNFSDALLIGRGGFGKVYKGLIDRGQTTVAIKRLKSNSNQGAHEFLTEIETLSLLQHINLVSLIGYCSERREMILVYEYMTCGTLADHLYKHPRCGNSYSSLTWKQLLNICIGAGRGLDYLHTGHGIIHRDVKSSNILLDEDFTAKISDFGLAKQEDRSKLQSHISTKVKGTFGYFDPYYFSTRKLSRKSDTYAFGVVLLEVLCGRPAVASWIKEDEHILTKWARDKINKGEVDQIVAANLSEEVSADSLKTFVGVAERCLHDEPKNRPKMSQVVLQLELALEQHVCKPSMVLNETTASGSDAILLGNNEEVKASVKMGEPALDVQNTQKHPKKEQTSVNMVKGDGELQLGRKDGRKTTNNKPSRLWPWDAFWNIVKPSKKNEPLLSDTGEDICEADIKLAKFDWETIADTTSKFSSSNKVAEGRSCSIYKGVLPSGQKIAVKCLLPSSTRGLRLFKHEILLLPNLVHQNIIKLLGYCIDRRGKFLLYEFMEYGSLDKFIEQREWFQWPLAFKVITGIARGLVYLHQDSGHGAIHGNLTPRHILLDREMNPKLSNFAFSFSNSTSVEHHSDQFGSTLISQAALIDYMHMSPENFMQGLVSFKSDVYSLGVIVLEIVSGTTIRIPSHSEAKVLLVDHAWELWNEGKALDLANKWLGGAFSPDEALRCIQVGLLCTKEQPSHRPDMPYVLKMLEGGDVLFDPHELQSRSPRDNLTWGSGNIDEVHSNATWGSGNIDEVHSNATFELDDTLER